MYKFFVVLWISIMACHGTFAQQKAVAKLDSAKLKFQKDSAKLVSKKPVNAKQSVDTAKSKRSFFDKLLKKDTTGQKPKAPLPPVVIESRKAALKSLLVPGLGQIQNIYSIKKDKERLKLEGKSFAIKKIFISSKMAGIYIADFLLVRSYLTERSNYREYLLELQTRQANNGIAATGSKYESIQTTVLQQAKDNADRNRDLSIFGLMGVHVLNVIDAYIDSRLRFFNVDDDLSFKLAPTIFTQPPLGASAWAMAVAPGIKLTIKL